MSLPLTTQEQHLARLHAHTARTIARLLRQHYLAQHDKSLTWGSGMNAAIEIVQRMVVALESAAPPDLTEVQAENMEWQKIAGLLMEKLKQTHVCFPFDWMETFNALPDGAAKVILAHEKSDGIHLLLLPQAEAQAYADLREQGQL